MKLSRSKQSNEQGGWIYIAVLIVIVVAVTVVVVVELARVARYDIPDPNVASTNTVADTFWTMRSANYNGNDNETPAPFGRTFAMQYTVDKFGGAWVFAGTNLEVVEYPTPETQFVETLVSDFTNLLAMIYLDNGWIIPFGFGTNDIYGPGPIAYWNPPPLNGNGETVVLERKAGLLSPWVQLWTNTLLRGSVLNYTDTEAPEEAYYRLSPLP